jgi:hypothetical protein
MRILSQQADVCQARVTVQEENVIWFDIAMDQSGIEKRLQALQHRADEGNNLIAAEPVRFVTPMLNQ